MIDAAEIARVLGGKRAGRDYLAKCPAHSDRTPSLSIREGVTGPLVHCHAGCPQRDVIEVLRERGLWPSPSRSSPRPPSSPRAPVRRDNQQWRQDAAAKIWNAAHDPRGTLAEKYLIGRGLELGDDLCGHVLRFHPCCPFGERTSVPALIAAFQPIRSTDDDAPPPAIHRIARQCGCCGHRLGKLAMTAEPVPPVTHVDDAIADAAKRAKPNGNGSAPAPLAWRQPDAPLRWRHLDGILKAVAKGTAPYVKEAIAEAVAPLIARITELESRPSLQDAGTWNDAKLFKAGDVCTHDGSAWVAQGANSNARPGTCGSWRLLVKRGRDAKGN